MEWSQRAARVGIELLAGASTTAAARALAPRGRAMPHGTLVACDVPARVRGRACGRSVRSVTARRAHRRRRASARRSPVAGRRGRGAISTTRRRTRPASSSTTSRTRTSPASDNFCRAPLGARITLAPERTATASSADAARRRARARRAHGGGRVVLWVLGAHANRRRRARDRQVCGPTATSTRCACRCRSSEPPRWPPGVDVRPFAARPRRAGVARGQQPRVREPRRAGRLDRGDTRPPHDRALVRPGVVPPRVRRQGLAGFNW